MKKKIIAGILACVCMISQFSQNVHATQNQIERNIQSADQWNRSEESLDEEKTVTVIVEIKANPILELYQQSDSTNLKRFLENNKTQVAAIQKQIESVKTAILNMNQKVRETAEFLYTYDTVFSGLSLKLPSSEVEKIKKLPNVKRVFTATTYQLPEDQIHRESDVQEMMTSSRNMVKSNTIQNQQDMDYTGKGETIAVLDSGLSCTHEAFTKTPENQCYHSEDMQELLDSESFASETDFKTFTRSTLTASIADDTASVYKSDKVPYAYDYMGHDTDVTPAKTTCHGTHVSGIIAGNSETMQGIAPDAQLMVLKVFDDNGSTNDAALLAALQDAVLLHPDAINMSLGTDAGFSSDKNEAMQKVYDRITEAGINLIVSAGNSATSANHSKLGNDATVENIDNGIVSNPSTLHAAMSVASIENATVKDAAFFQDSEGENCEYTENATADQFFSNLGKGIYHYVDCGTGEQEAFQNKNVEGKIALIQRGGMDANGDPLTFGVKVKNAANAGAIAAIIYNNVDGSFRMAMEKNEYLIPAISVTKGVGEKLLCLAIEGEGSISFEPGQSADIQSEQANQMSTFSSWGTTPNLGIKPEITAPGGNIYSAYYVNLDGSSAYGNMSGTSMASPHIAGAAVVVRQYLKEKYPEYTGTQLEQMTNTLLMSTATPVEDSKKENASEKRYASVRQQGAGLLNLEAAVTTQAYMNVKGSERPKAELGYCTDGKYTFTAEIVNTGDEAISYEFETVVQIPDYYTGENQINYIAQNDVVLQAGDATVTYAGSAVKGNTVTVMGGNTEAVTVTVQLNSSSDTIIKYGQIFQNGFYVEGFLMAKSPDAQMPDLSVPYLGFYGDWSAASLFDASVYEQEKIEIFEANDLHTPKFYVGEGANVQAKQIILGQNPLAVINGEGDQSADREHMVISQNSKYVNDVRPTTVLLRGADTLAYRIENQTGETVKTYTYDLIPKTYYMASTNTLITAEEELESYKGEIHFNGNDQNGKRLPQGEYQFVIEGSKAGVREEAKKRESISYTITIDDTEPELEKERTVLYEEDGQLYAHVEAKDNRGLAGFALKMQKSQGEITSFYKYINCLTEDCQTFELGSIDDLQQVGYVFEKTTVEAYDYAMNSSVIELEMGDKPEEKEKPIIPTTPEQPKGIGVTTIKKAVSQKDGSISVQFAKVSKADGYEVYRKNSKTGTYKRLMTTKKNTIVDKQNLTFGKTYFYKVRAYKKNGNQTVYGAFSKERGVTSTNFGVMRLKSVKKISKIKLKISWEKMNGAKGYELYRSSGKNGTYKKIKTITKGKITSYVDLVSKKKAYYYKIRPFGKNGKKIVKGKFSAVKIGKTN